MTPSLVSQQQSFYDHVTQAPHGERPPEGLMREGQVTASQRLSVYQHAYTARLVDALRDDYPLTSHALGDECFDTLCQTYAAAFPPDTNSLNYYGRHFAAFAREASAYASELARVEWALIEAIHSDASQVLSPTVFGRFRPEQWAQLRLQTSETLRVLELEYDIAPYLAALANSEAIAPPEKRRSHLAICRRGNDLWRLPLEAWAFDLLRQLTDGVPLGQALEASCSDGTVAEEQVFLTFARWLEAGVFRNAVPY